jgi:hypothetical protein
MAAAVSNSAVTKSPSWRACEGTQGRGGSVFIPASTSEIAAQKPKHAGPREIAIGGGKCDWCIAPAVIVRLSEDEAWLDLAKLTRSQSGHRIATSGRRSPNPGLNWLCTFVDVVAGRPVMNDMTDEYWGTLILEMAEDATRLAISGR